MGTQNDSDSLFGALMRRLHAPIYEKRISVLSDAIVSYVSTNDLILDVGCGSGSLGRAILDSPRCPEGVRVVGLESRKRGGEAIEVQAYDGRTLPYADGAAEIVILADVLHHEEQPQRLLAESIRVARRIVFIKDHKVDGFLAQQRISLLDWAANTGYGVDCLYQYISKQGWKDFLAGFPVNVTDEIHSLDLYPPFFNLVFGRKLHYCVILRKPS